MSPQRLPCSCPTPQALEGTENPPLVFPSSWPFPWTLPHFPLPHRLASIRKGLPSFWIFASYPGLLAYLILGSCLHLSFLTTYLWRPLYWKTCLVGWGLEGDGN